MLFLDKCLFIHKLYKSEMECWNGSAETSAVHILLCGGACPTNPSRRYIIFGGKGKNQHLADYINLIITVNFFTIIS